MKNKLFVWLKKAIIFFLVAGISFVVLVMTIGNSEIINQDGLLSFVLVFLPFVAPVVLGLWAAKKFCTSKNLQTPECPDIEIPMSDLEVVNSRKCTKKPFYKRWWIWIVVFILFIGSCSVPVDESVPAYTTVPVSETITSEPVAPITFPEHIDSDSTKTTHTTEVTETIVATEATISTSIIESTATETTIPPVSLDVAVQILDDILAVDFTNYNISHNDNLVLIEVWEDGVAAGVDSIARGNIEAKNLWNELIENYESLSITYGNLIRDMGLADISVTINLLNDTNTENTLLSVVDGTVVYNFLDYSITPEASVPSAPTEETISPRDQLDTILATYDPGDYEEQNHYVLNTNTMKFHHPWCNSVDEIKPANRTDVEANRSDLISNGYKACKRCNP